MMNRILYGLAASALLFVVWSARRGGDWTTAATAIVVLWTVVTIGWLLAEFVVESLEARS